MRQAAARNNKTTYAIELFGSHINVVIVLVGFLEGFHHGRIKKIDGCLGGYADAAILELEESIPVAGMLGRDEQQGSDRNEGEGERSEFHHGRKGAKEEGVWE